MLKGRNTRNEIELQLWQYYSSSVLRDLEINVLGGQYQISWREYQLWWHYFDNKERRGKLISFTTGSPLRPIPVSLEDILLKRRWMNFFSAFCGHSIFQLSIHFESVASEFWSRVGHLLNIITMLRTLIYACLNWP